MRGCESEDTAVEAYTIRGRNYWRCPKKLFDMMPVEDQRMINKLMLAYYYSERGILPKAGGYEDQDRLTMECIPIINRYVNLEGTRKAKEKLKEKPKGLN